MENSKMLIANANLSKNYILDLKEMILEKKIEID